MEHRNYLITGATSGIGFETARQLRMAGADLIAVGRTKERCETAADKLASVSSGSVEFISADLSDTRAVHEAAKTALRIIDTKHHGELDGIINNAATVPSWQTLTAEGFDMQWAVNYLAGFLLTQDVLESRQENGGIRTGPIRIINVSSGTHYGSRLDWNDLQTFRRYRPIKAYGRTKIAQLLFTTEVNRRFGETGVQAFAADPGLVRTDIGLKSNSRIAAAAWRYRRRHGGDPEQAAADIIWLLNESSLDPAVHFYYKRQRPKPPDSYVLDRDRALRLWEATVAMCPPRHAEDDGRE